ncbi:Beta-L-arabinofuranosidase, Glycosyl hydrolase family [Bifidobacterium ramosum]|uniref:Beta-L-arabinofuranosidase, Glycosyl hydrolase family n=1 Tax=Bifidobacterium ramosum TaxID=1798158 RepID=A0A6L4X1I3_9BIFI|nr:beta-L-arabinofuranosidase domain-containing protein [Bifidobacterium ramosum]KAB8288402.1 Beta-L-arabinofuranosidase, Glycosyl hydrolase family [Bifidobacterium ramosum]NEG71563.1 glycoside hydrolase family 127 protein [Bifidobacterium ramosum]
MQIATPVLPSTEAVSPLSIHESTIDGGFWATMQKLNADRILPHIITWERRMGWVDNFRLSAEHHIEQRRGAVFTDSDVYKMLEAIAWELGRQPNDALQREFDDIVQWIAKAQREDGYLETSFGDTGQPARYSDLEWGHELYCCGHLLQAATARIRIGHPDCALVGVARRFADRIVEDFAPGRIERIGGHPEIETAMLEFGRATGNDAYIQAATRFINRRGHHTLADSHFGREYFQDDIPIRQATRLRGHAVRALYLTAGAIDCAVENHDDELLGIVRRQYQDTLEKRTYLTGGMGSRHSDEAFGDDYELPPDRAYCETCAGVGSIMVAWRLLLATGDLSYGNIIERTLYNVIAASPSTDGTSFFYVNPLQQRNRTHEAAPDQCSLRAQASTRAPWFEVACCPSNVSRTLGQLSAYVAVNNGNGLSLIQFMPGTIRTTLHDGGTLALRIETQYPDDGIVTITVLDAPQTAWTFSTRIPDWAGTMTVTVNGRSRTDQGAQASLTGVMPAGTTIRLEMPVAPRITYPDMHIDAVRGCAAVERGPIVYCMESIDQKLSQDLNRYRIDPQSTLTDDGRYILATGSLLNDGPTDDPTDGSADDGRLPYHDAEQHIGGQPCTLRLVPYHDWANRGPSTMRVWIPLGE